MSTLAVVGIALLALVVGLAIGAWLTGRRYQRTLQPMGTVHDLTDVMQRRWGE